MAFFRINLSPYEDMSYCRITDDVIEFDDHSYLVRKGKPAISEYPEDPRIYMSDEYEGIRLPDLVANMNNYLLVSKKVKETIEKFIDKEKVEYLPVHIYNHKKRLASKDYFIINLLGTYDCLKLDRCEIRRFRDGRILEVREFVADSTKLKNAPPLFRIQEQTDTFVISGDLAFALKEEGVTNFYLFELDEE